MPEKNKDKFVVVGFGWVGQANALSLALLGYDVAFFDVAEPVEHYAVYAKTYAGLTRLKAVDGWDAPTTWYIVCVGDMVSEDGVQDISKIRSALDSLSGVKGGVILRSTIIPDTLESLKFDYYVPEFLHEKKAVEESLKPHFFIVGARAGARPEPALFSVLRARAHKTFDGSPREASFIKYLSNLWNALRIAFVNEFGDAIGRPSDKEHLAEIDKILGFLFENRDYVRYGRAFGGHCLPKDTRAFLGAYAKEGSLPLLAGAYASNDRHRELESRFPLMPEWYSEWSENHISGWRALKELLYSIRKNSKRLFLRSS